MIINSDTQQGFVPFLIPAPHSGYYTKTYELDAMSQFT